MAVVRLQLRGRYDREAETEKVRIIVSSAPQTGGRSRQFGKEVYDTVEDFESDFGDYLDQSFPDNTPAP